jgi:hypothetical protein
MTTHYDTLCHKIFEDAKKVMINVTLKPLKNYFIIKITFISFVNYI